MASFISRSAGQLTVFALFFGAWEIFVKALGVRPVILPAPSDVFWTIVKHWAYLVGHTWPTVVAICSGFLFAVLTGLVIAIGIAYSKWISDLTYAFLVAAQVLRAGALRLRRRNAAAASAGWRARHCRGRCAWRDRAPRPRPA